MDRKKALLEIADTSILWDMVIIGGGASGIGTAVDAASRGYKVLLVEQSDFGKGTSSRSTKLAHGGVRYLQQGNISLVLEALKERGIMHKNAPHLVKNLAFIVPVYDWWEGPFYGIGLKMYDMLAGRGGFGASRYLSKNETIRQIPTIEKEGLRGGVIYYDGQFDDARMLINLAQTAFEQGATIINYMKLDGLINEDGLINGVKLNDQETNNIYRLKTKLVINATGVFADSIRCMDDPDAERIMTSSQGVHLVLDKKFLPAENAIMVPHTDDGRVLFAVPWLGKVIVGTTDTYVEEYLLEPVALEEEISYLIDHSGRYLQNDPTYKDIKSIFVGLRPLVKEAGDKNTASISREHTINISRSGLLTIAGGKWTTYRKMAEEAVDHAIELAGLEHNKSNTTNLQLHGYHKHTETFGDFKQYGSDAPELMDLLEEKPSYKNRLHRDFSNVEGEVIWAVRYEMARRVEDFLSRRTRLLLLDARAAGKIAERVALIMAEELNRNKNWINQQVKEFSDLASNYYIT